MVKYTIVIYIITIKCIDSMNNYKNAQYIIALDYTTRQLITNYIKLLGYYLSCFNNITNNNYNSDSFKHNFRIYELSTYR